MDEAPETKRVETEERASARASVQLRVARIMWSSLFGSNVVLFGLVAGHVLSAGPGALQPMMPDLFGAMAFGIALMSIVLPARLFRSSLRGAAFAVTNEPGEMIGSFRESAPMRKRVSEPAQAVVAVFARYQTSFIIGMALAEAVGLLGLMLGYLGAPLLRYAPLSAVSIVLMAARFPQLATLTRAIERATGASCDLTL